MYKFPETFIEVIKCLYVRPNVQVNINGHLTEPFEVMRGVKQGCPLRVALYVLAISPLIHKIENDSRLIEVKLGH